VNSIALQRVKYVPKDLAPGILYVSDEYAIAAHLCICGCANKVVTPLGPAEWTFSERNGRPTLRPSIGNWQLACRSHYVISDGQIQWADQWTDAQVATGRQAEEHQRQAHYASLGREQGLWTRAWKFLRKLLGL
jgi:hypothetical protein